MAMKAIDVDGRAFFERAKKLKPKLEAALRVAMVKAGEFGMGAVQRTIRQTDPKPIATGTYSMTWNVTRTAKGAVLGTTAMHGIFVEIGRRPGRMPPVSAIEEWVRVKRLAFRPKALRGRSKSAAKARERYVRTLAWLVARKIGRKGFRGRYPLKRTMPDIRKYAMRETALQLGRVKP